MKKIAILASGTGSNAENIFNFFSNGNRVKIELVIYDRADAPVAKRMREHNVDTIYIPGEVWRERPDEILEMLSQRGIDLIVLAGFLRFVPEQITRAYAGRMINIHPSLLPAYGGKGMYGHKVHEAVIAAGETRSGATVHYVTDKIDGGDILMQEVVTVTPDDTPDSLEQKVHKAEYSLYPRAIVAALGRLEMNAPEPEEATGASARATQESEAPENPENPEASEAPVPPAREWAETLGVRYDPPIHGAAATCAGLCRSDKERLWRRCAPHATRISRLVGGDDRALLSAGRNRSNHLLLAGQLEILCRRYRGRTPKLGESADMDHCQLRARRALQYVISPDSSPVRITSPASRGYGSGRAPLPRLATGQKYQLLDNAI